MSLTEQISEYCLNHLDSAQNPEAFASGLRTAFDLSREDALLLTLRVLNERHNRTDYPLIHLELVVAEACNLRCDYCFCGPQRDLLMDEGTGRQAIDYLLRESGAATQLYVTFFGGEPLLAIDIVCRLTDYGNEAAGRFDKKISWSMTTNGTLLNEATLEALQNKKLKILISIDGDREAHDRHRLTPDGSSAYDRVVKSLPLVEQYQPWMGARMTITPDNVDRASDNVRHLLDLGFKQLLIAPAECRGWNRTARNRFSREMVNAAKHYYERKQTGNLKIERFEPAEFLPESKPCAGRRGCKAGRTSVAVTPDKTVYACSKFINSASSQKPHTLGTLGSGDEIAIRDRLPADLRQTPWRQACLSCDFLFRCTGGCPAVNYHATGYSDQTSQRECLLKQMEMQTKDRIGLNMLSESCQTAPEPHLTSG